MEDKRSKFMVTAAKQLLSIVGNLATMLEARGADVGETFYRLASSDGEETLNKIADMMINVAIDTYRITVDGSKSLAEMVAAGRYNYVHPNITSENFPSKMTGKMDIDTVLVHLGQRFPSRTVLAELDKRGLRPATIFELLAFGAKNSGKQQKFPIVALGSVNSEQLLYGPLPSRMRRTFLELGSLWRCLA